jgi:hypothetical protein
VLAMRFNEGHDPDPLTEPFENDIFTRVVINRGEISYH